MDDSNEPPPPAHVPPPAAAYRWLGVFESLAVLLACVAVILALSVAELWLLAPRLYTAEFELVEQRHVGDGRASTTEELLEQLSRLGLDADADVRERRGRTLLSISGLRSADTIDGTVNGLLVESGFDAAEGRIRTGLDWQGMITRHPVLILGAQAIVLIAFGLAFSRLRVGPARERPRARASVAVAFGVAAGLAGFACALILGLLQELLGLSIEEQAWLLELLRDRDSLFAVAPLVAVVAPLAEETFFRGYMFRFLLQRSGAWPAYLLSAVCFSLIHFHLPGLLTYFALGLLFAWVCHRTSSVLAPFVGHAIYNSLALGIGVIASGG